MVKQIHIATLARYACFFALVVIALGAFTRLIDAGLGCPDWPGCYGHLTAPMNMSHSNIYKAWAEMIHRYAVSLLSIFILVIISLVGMKKECRTRGNIIFSISLLLLLFYQILLGQWTVTLKLLPVVVSQHLLGGFLILSMLWLIYLNNRADIFSHPSALSEKPRQRLIFLSLIALILLLLQIMLGAWTSTNYTALSCPDFPFCVNNQPAMTLHFKEAFNLLSPVGMNYEGGVLSESIRQTIQMSHRFGALIVTLYSLLLIFYAAQQLKHSSDGMKQLYIILGLLCIQLALGVSNVIFQLPIVTAISHTIVAALLLLSLVTFIFDLIVRRF